MTQHTVQKEAPVKVTDRALDQLRLIREEKNVPDDYGLRIGVDGGGCAGFSYQLGFDQKKDSDQIFEVGGQVIFMNKAHGLYLLGMEIDWHEGLNNRGFIFKNPNATDTCGCGTSFSA